jgi:meso-butanediol dehydrogenase/(S,S)-butanediol dehydrogenase/diacetyl reductase
MAARLSGKVAIVTGAGGGIGRAITELFCLQQASVLMVDQDGAQLAEVSDTIRKSVAGARIESVVCNVSDYDQVARSVETAVSCFGGVNVLVNNAAIRTVATLENKR